MSGAFDVSFREGSFHESNQFQKPANLKNPNHLAPIHWFNSVLVRLNHAEVDHDFQHKDLVGNGRVDDLFVFFSCFPSLGGGEGRNM